MKRQQTCNGPEDPMDLNRLVEEIISGYCRDIPYNVYLRIIDIYHRYGIWAALEAAAAVVDLDRWRKIDLIKKSV
jgi:hypothetical protein